jgi:hypothetical protein
MHVRGRTRSRCERWEAGAPAIGGCARGGASSGRTGASARAAPGRRRRRLCRAPEPRPPSPWAHAARRALRSPACGAGRGAGVRGREEAGVHTAHAPRCRRGAAAQQCRGAAVPEHADGDSGRTRALPGPPSSTRGRSGPQLPRLHGAAHARRKPWRGAYIACGPPIPSAWTRSPRRCSWRRSPRRSPWTSGGAAAATRTTGRRSRRRRARGRCSATSRCACLRAVGWSGGRRLSLPSLPPAARGRRRRAHPNPLPPAPHPPPQP